MDQLAGKEMSIGRFYLNRRNYTAAINRFRAVLTNYQTTRHAEEALYRLVEAYLGLGITDEAQTAAAILGHNFPDGEWYKDAYALLQKGGLQPHENQEFLDVQALPRRRSVLTPAGVATMLARLSIRDIVLIDQLDLEFSRGLDDPDRRDRRGQIDPARCAFARARRARRRRAGAPWPAAGPSHRRLRARRSTTPSPQTLAEQDIAFEGELILRRVQMADGRTRAYVNDQSVSAQTLRALAAELVEIHGQHDERALLDRLDPSRAGRRLWRARDRSSRRRARPSPSLRALEGELARERAGVAEARRGRRLRAPRQRGTRQARGQARRGGSARRASASA